ncbi:hypothetical protein RchiOBHm_Chr1g0347711 [Rosa chinensis]|uniref:Uncharacterized protein n=1 Tax=Rosa chinensis TaxID=74649 RepID=A0A2P6SFD0_ROSCH|nr:hypothetical protein RchiOBHm_Chr1g0347711 [Rosa chinensis]
MHHACFDFFRIGPYFFSGWGQGGFVLTPYLLIFYFSLFRCLILPSAYCFLKYS